MSALAGGRVNPLASPCRHFRYADDTPGIGKLGMGIAAGDYQRLGYAVLPLQRVGKRPHKMLGERGGVHHASLAGADVKRWWSGDPAANVGVATGSKSRLAVLDLDVKAGKDGIAELTRFMASYWLDLPEGCWVRTPTGGVHIWLRTPLGVRVPDHPGILPGVDIKGDGGFVVAPPSMRLHQPIKPEVPGDSSIRLPYEWNGCPCQAPDAPSWLFEWLDYAAPAAGRPAQLVRNGEQVYDASPPQDDGPDLKALLKTGVPKGERNDTLYRLACSLYRKHGTSSRVPAEEVARVWTAGDRTGFAWDEVQVVLDSARRFVAAQERNDTLLRQRTMGWLER